MKRIITAAIFLITTQSCLAAGWGDLSGKNKYGDLIDVFPAVIDGDPQDYRKEDGSEMFDVLFYKGGNLAASNAKKYTDLRCKLKLSKKDVYLPIELACEKSGKSPMSGTTYKIVRNKNLEDCSYEFMYICTRGCDNPVVPQRMMQNYWECSAARVGRNN
jgi:hypothetical protein